MKLNVCDWLLKCCCLLLLKCQPGNAYFSSTEEISGEWANTRTNALLSVIPRNTKNSRTFPRFLSYYAKKVFPDKLDEGIAQALEHHIEAMEPQFRSASFSHLWHALKLPLTNLFRPKGLEKLSRELQACLPKNTENMYKHPTDVERVKRDLIICRIGDVLDTAMVTRSGSGLNPAGSATSSPGSFVSPKEPGNEVAGSDQSFLQLWSLLREPLMQCLLIADLSNMIEELVPCFPRFELAGIQYKLPSRMSDIQRDVVICKVDEIFNEVYNRNGLSVT